MLNSVAKIRYFLRYITLFLLISIVNVYVLPINKGLADISIYLIIIYRDFVFPFSFKRKTMKKKIPARLFVSLAGII